MLWTALRRVVVETWEDCWAAPRWPSEATEYMDMRLLAMTGNGWSGARAGCEDTGRPGQGVDVEVEVEVEDIETTRLLDRG